MTEDAPETVTSPVKKRRGRPPGSARSRQPNHEPSREPSGRAERIPLGSPRQKLTTDQIRGFQLRWINDKGSRIQQALQGGWYFVDRNDLKANTSDPGDSCISQIVGTKESGEPMRAYLMKIREDWYEEDQAAKRKRREEIVAQIESGVDERGGPGEDGRYLPSVLQNRLR